jgi:hypothetical protein
MTPSQLVAIVLAVACGIGGCGTSTVGLRARNTYNGITFVEPRSGDPLRPTLEWERLPRVSDPRLNAARNVTYELRMWQVWQQYPPSPMLVFAHASALAYTRAGLLEARHTVETPLQAGSVYAWAVRARFDLDGQARVTAWSAWAPAEFEHLLRAPIAPPLVSVLYKVMTPLPPGARSGGLPSAIDPPQTKSPTDR